MIVVASISLLALFLTFLESKFYFKNGMLYGFILVTILGCIHYDYGNDYMSYYDLYNYITSIPFNFADTFQGNVYKEPGWAFLCYLFKPLGGFFSMVAVLNIIQNFIVYKIIKTNVEGNWWPFAVFIYLFIPSFYLLNFSMMRQGLVICLFLGAWNYIKNKQFIKAGIIILVGSTIHTSALILLPFAFWGFIPFKRGWLVGIVFFVLYLILWFSGDFMNNALSLFLSDEEFEEYFTIYSYQKANLTYRLGFLLKLIPLFLSLVFITLKNYHRTAKAVVTLSMISFIVEPFSQIIPLISRIGIYFGVYQTIAMPIVYSSIKNKNIAWAFLFIYCFMILYSYYRFFRSPVYQLYYATFKTIFSVL